jgi:hypothetical protein
MIHNSILSSRQAARPAWGPALVLLLCAAFAASAFAQAAPPLAQSGEAESAAQLPAKVQAKLDKLQADLKAAQSAGDARTGA